MAFETLLAELESIVEDEGQIPGVYRCRDNISNLEIRIRIRELGDGSSPERSSGLSSGRVGSGSPVHGTDNSAVSLPKSSEPTYEEEITLHWQEKIFSKGEFRLYANEDDKTFDNPVQKKLACDAKKQMNEGFVPKNRIFTEIEGEKERESAYVPATTDPSEEPSFLSMLVQEGIRRRGTFQTSSAPPTRNIVVEDPSIETQIKNHIVLTNQQLMVVKLDLEKDDEIELCTISYSSQGVLTVQPDFTWSGRPYRLELEGSTWELWIHHSSKTMDYESQVKERKMLNEVYARQTQLQQAQVGDDFEMPPAGVLRFYLQAEITTAEGFENDNLRINYIIRYPPGWSEGSESDLYGVTQQCRTTCNNKGRDVANFSYPIEADLFFNLSQLEISKEDIPRWPQLLIEVVSEDYWGRTRIEGYGHVTLPTLPGHSQRTIQTWIPTVNTPSWEMRRYFIGGTPELQNLDYCGNIYKGGVNNRLGLGTRSSGAVTVKFNVIHQAKAFMLRPGDGKKKSRRILMDRLSSATLFTSVNTVLEAFKRAREKLVKATGNLEQNP